MRTIRPKENSKKEKSPMSGEEQALYMDATQNSKNHDLNNQMVPNFDIDDLNLPVHPDNPEIEGEERERHTDNKTKIQNDVYNQIIKDLDVHPPMKRPGFFSAFIDFSRIGNLIRLINLGGFIASLYFTIQNVESYGYCILFVVLSFILYWVDILVWSSTFKSLKNIKIVQ